ncbi:aminoacyl-tRNA hydrolase [Flavobacterium sp. B11]|uniref:aminoacyl-tRNA hydrolase n=1 Tax=Flavobacterium movens TaxID=214860 RepID=UPI0031E16CC3
MIKWITKLFSSLSKEENIEDNMKPEVHEHQKNNIKNVSKKYLIVGLGNIGAEYVNTRHNIGFKVLDFLAKKEGLSFETVKLGSMAEYKFKGRTFFLLKPNTYMNLSGKAVKYWMDKENIPLENILVITDDLNLSFGTIRIKPKGSDGGHNGLKNINLVLNTQNYTRYRFGISDEFKKGQQVDYVLGEWTAEEEAKLPERLETSAEIIRTFGTAGLENTMTTFNGK